MSIIHILVIATFTSPEQIRLNPQAMLWLLPLTAAIATVYKATKLPKIAASTFFKEVVVLFGSIIAFIIITALALYALVWLMSV